MDTRATIGIALIVKNEEAEIRGCLESVKWADEIVVLDSGSVDKTVEIARQYTDKVQVTDWPGYGIQKNRALSLLTTDWVLSIDADERVSDALRDEILAVVSEGSCEGYEIPRRSSYCGKFINHSGWVPDYVLRLAKKDTARFTESVVHERMQVKGDCKKLKNPILHYTYRDLSDVLEMIQRYSDASAKEMYKAGKKGGLLSAISHGFWTFLKTYFFRLGFLDGREGFMLAFSNAELAYYKYMKLYYLNKKHNEVN
jgi:glycosyltransferase involved in cell wall biosynthesis